MSFRLIPIHLPRSPSLVRLSSRAEKQPQPPFDRSILTQGSNVTACITSTPPKPSPRLLRWGLNHFYLRGLHLLSTRMPTNLSGIVSDPIHESNKSSAILLAIKQHTGLLDRDSIYNNSLGKWGALGLRDSLDVIVTITAKISISNIGCFEVN